MKKSEKKTRNSSGDNSCHQTRAAMSRRDFLAQSAKASAGVLFLPGISALLSDVAYGATCGPTTAGGTATPFICLDLAGGGNIAGSNVMVGGFGGQSDFLPDYTSLGITTGRSPRPNQTDFVSKLSPQSQLLFHQDSAFFEGMTNELTATARCKVDGMIFCARSGDDTQNNPHNPIYWIARSQIRKGYKGELTTLVGSTSASSGGNSTISVKSFDGSLPRVRIAGPSDALNLIDVGVLKNWIGGTGVSGDMIRARAERILKTVNNFSGSQLAAFSSLDMPSQVRALIDCGFLSSKDSVNKYLGDDRVGQIDPTQDPNYIPLFGLGMNATTTPTGATRSGNAVNKLRNAAGIAKLVLEGKANAGTIAFGGYDYHNVDRTTTDNRDREAGHVVGALINAAEKQGKDLMIYLFTDGGVASGNSVSTSMIGGQNINKLMWNSDNGTKGSTVLLVYRHAGLPEMRRNQVGRYNASGSVESTANLVSNNVENLAQAVVANYLALSGSEGTLASVLGADPFGAELENYLGFTKL